MNINPMIIYTILLVLLVFASLMAVLSRTLLKAAISLALASVVLTVIMFMMNSPLAAVFELSVCAGLITALFVSVISLTNRLTNEQIMEMTRTRLRTYWYLIAMVIIGGAVLLFMCGMPKDISAIVPKCPPAENVKFVFWNVRVNDLIGQIAVILTGVFGVAVLLKEVFKKND